jgi:hypothetical protein
MPLAAPSPASPPSSLRAASSSCACLPSFSAAARRKQQAAASSSLMEVLGQSQCGEGRLSWVWGVSAGAPTAAAVGQQRGLSWLDEAEMCGGSSPSSTSRPGGAGQGRDVWRIFVLVFLNSPLGAMARRGRARHGGEGDLAQHGRSSPP